MTNIKYIRKLTYKDTIFNVKLKYNIKFGDFFIPKFIKIVSFIFITRYKYQIYNH